MTNLKADRKRRRKKKTFVKSLKFIDKMAAKSYSKVNKIITNWQ